jgi:hypothetical protein
MPLMDAVQVAEPSADLAMVQREVPEPGQRPGAFQVGSDNEVVSCKFTG